MNLMKKFWTTSATFVKKKKPKLIDLFTLQISQETTLFQPYLNLKLLI